MPVFRYDAYDANTRRVAGSIDAPSEVDATELLHSRGLTVVQIGAGATSAVSNTAAQPAARLSTTEWAAFARQLATLMAAELPIDQGLRLVAAQNPNRRTGQLATKLAEAIIAGQPLSAALTDVAPDAPPFITPLVRAGEARGTLKTCLTELARILERRAEIATRMKSALIYPTVLLIVAMIAVGIVFAVLVPTLMPLFQDSNIEAPAVLRIADAISKFVTANLAATATTCLALFAAFYLLLRQPSVKARLQALLARLPVIGPLLTGASVAMVARTLGTLVRNGVPLVTALDLAATVASTSAMRTAVATASQSVKEGGKLAAALDSSNAFPEMALRFIAIGEASSRLDDMLLHLADAADAENQRHVDTVLNLLTPLMTIIIGLLIGALILAVMQAVVGVNNLALR